MLLDITARVRIFASAQFPVECVGFADIKFNEINWNSHLSRSAACCSVVVHCWWYLEGEFLEACSIGIDDFEVVTDDGVHERVVNQSCDGALDVMRSACSSGCEHISRGSVISATEVKVIVPRSHPWKGEWINGCGHAVLKESAVNIKVQDSSNVGIKVNSAREGYNGVLEDVIVGVQEAAVQYFSS